MKKYVLNPLRVVIYIIAMLYIIPGLFYGLGWLALKMEVGVIKLNSVIHPIFIGLIIFIIGAFVVEFVWKPFKAFSGMVIYIANKISPYDAVTEWATILITFGTMIIFLYGYWSASDNGTSIYGWIVGIILTAMSLGLSFAICKGSLFSIEHKRISLSKGV